MVQLESGDLVDARFEVEFCAGVGGMGKVYRCRDATTGRSVALKVIATESAANRERFAREVRLLAELRHPGIVRHVAHGVLQGGEPYLAMEWVDGDALSGRVCGEPLSVRDALSVLRRLCDALDGAHARGIVHRDIKPANIILEGGKLEAPKLLDFGLARAIDTTHAITRTGAMVGTPAYMAPEQARRTADLDTRVDVFALGCVLFECLAGFPAFRGPNVVSVLCKVLLEDPPWLGDIRTDVPGPLCDLVASMLAKDPAGRPHDARAVREALDALNMKELGAGSQRPSLGVDEQRYLSVILAGRPRGGAHAEPPTAISKPRLLLGMHKAVALFDAEMSQLIDSTVMLTLRGGGTAVDRASRAARCALAVRDLMPQVPVVLATGRGMLRVRQPVGEVIDEAAQLLQLAAEVAPSDLDGGPLLVDAVSASLLDEHFELRERENRVELLAYRSQSVEPRKLLGRATPCVGRARELATLRAVWDECVSEPVARPIVITGPAGIGKTRLVREWIGELMLEEPRTRVVAVRADQMGAGGAFGMLARVVRSAAGVLDGESASGVQHKVRALVEQQVRAPDVERVADFLSDMAGAAQAGDESVAQRAARHDPVLRGDQIRRAFQDWLAAESTAHPVLLVLEDLQWGDLPTVDLLGSILRNLADHALCVVALSRPELEERFPRLWADRDVTTLSLGPLRFRAAVQLVCAALEGIDDGRAEGIAKRSGGNPFFLEELIRAEAEGRSERLPGNVIAMLQARLDELSPALRLVLRAASIFGDAFSEAGVAELLGEESVGLSRSVEALLEREVLVSAAQHERLGPDELLFAQGLWREASYATLTEQDRRLGHALAASYLENKRPGEAYAIAEHFQLGQRPEKAASWFLAAARHALQGGDYNGAVARAERGIACQVAGLRGELRCTQAEAHKWRGANADAERCAVEAMELLPVGSAVWYAAAGEMAAASGKLANRERLTQLAEALQRAAPETQDAALVRVMALTRAATQLVLAGRLEHADQLLACLGDDSVDASVAGWVHEARAVRAGSASDPSGRVAMAQRAAECFSAVGDLRNACLQRTSVGFALNEIGSFEAAQSSLLEAIALGERLGLSNAVSTAKAQLGRAQLYRAQLGQAEDTLRAAINELRAQENQRLEGVARGYLAWLMHETERLPAAEAEARRAVQVLGKSPPLLAGASAILAKVLLSQGNTEEAGRFAAEASAILESMGTLSTGEAWVRLVRVETLLALGQHAEAAKAAESAYERLKQRAEQIGDGELRACFERIPEHVRTRQLYAAALGRGS